ncbi:STAS domain-containing protein [Streptomyces sp. NPDC048111]|uniref:STAS domain-containing protein n=1 Tax=Streptomyces sp. NPDC048111 TaxID=3365500 RepID=UPI0037141942
MAESKTTGAEPGEQLSAVVSDKDGVRVVTLTGEIDYDSADVLRRALDTTGCPVSRVIADLHQVTFLDSSGINALISAHHARTESGGRLQLAAPTETVLRTLQMVGLDTVVDTHPTLQQALDN